MEKRLIIAIAISVLIILGFQYLGPKSPPKPMVEIPHTAQGEVPVTVTEPVPPSPKDDFSKIEKVDTVDMGRFILTFSNIGGAIKSIQLKDYKSSDKKTLLTLLDLGDPKDYICSISGNIDNSPIFGTIFSRISDGNLISYYAKVDGVEIIKRYTVDDKHFEIKHDIVFRNIQNQAKTISYRMNGGAGLVEVGAQDERFVEVTAKIDDKILGFKKPGDGKVSYPGNVNWVAAKNKYFSIVVKPAGDTTLSAFYYKSQDGYLVDGLAFKEASLPAQSFLEYSALMYVGPSSTASMAASGQGFDETINYGFFGIISHALIAASKIIFNIVRNWGFAIIILSILLNILLFPLSMKSFSSMRKMHELHPQMEKLKALHKDNPQRLNKEILELYKKYNVNPFSGCLPMLLQMPIFIALYQALSRSIELRGASFLWIKDLSMPDAVSIPITLPIVGNSINILPLLMVAGMVFQQRLSTKVMGSAVSDEQKQQQKMMLVIMPIMFGFIFYNMPSGLVLYWLVNTVMTTFEQAIVFKNA